MPMWSSATPLSPGLESSLFPSGVGFAPSVRAAPATGGSGSSLYDSITDFAVHTPSWVQSLFSLFTNYGLLIYVALFVVTWWRARAKSNPKFMALALLAPLGTGGAYLVSEVTKSLIHEERPCRGLAQAATVLPCPVPGDWSFPSNHATIAAAATVGLIFAWRKLAPWVVSIALLMAFSRVFVGAHYPHDVAVGLIVGAVVAFLVVRLLLGLMTSLVAKLESHRGLGRFVSANPGDNLRAESSQSPEKWADGLSNSPSSDSPSSDSPISDGSAEAESAKSGSSISGDSLFEGLQDDPRSVPGVDHEADHGRDAPTQILPRQEDPRSAFPPGGQNWSDSSRGDLTEQTVILSRTPSASPRSANQGGVPLSPRRAQRRPSPPQPQSQSEGQPQRQSQGQPQPRPGQADWPRHGSGE
jgi:undecaprenyl-diphosphatase